MIGFSNYFLRGDFRHVRTQQSLLDKECSDYMKTLVVDLDQVLHDVILFIRLYRDTFGWRQNELFIQHNHERNLK